MKHAAATLVLALFACEAEEAASDPKLPVAAAPSPEVETWVPGEDECGQCHDEVAEQWARSRHHSAFTNPDFSQAWARQPLAFCRDCHAPGLTRSSPLPDADAEQLGVSCLDCHLDAGTLVTGGTPDQPNEAPHALQRSPQFATHSCARCHEFEFPARSWRPPGTMMQLTMREHVASAHAERSCADCHMPARDHGFASTRDPDAMRRALQVQARRDENTLELELTPVGVGHAFPTGDIYRRLELHAELVSNQGERLASTTRYLARQFEPRRRPDGRLNQAARLPTPDDRLTGPTTIRLELDVDAPPPDATLVWWVDYERVDHRDSHEPERSTLADEVRLAHGRL